MGFTSVEISRSFKKDEKMIQKARRSRLPKITFGCRSAKYAFPLKDFQDLSHLIIVVYFVGENG
jgi:hypothetical protein